MSHIDRQEGIRLLETTKLVAIVRGLPKRLALPFTQALYDAGVKVLEFTMNSGDAAEIIEEVQARFGKVMWIGAGTVTDMETAVAAKQAGASFFVSPNVDEDVIRFANEQGIAMIGGAMTPTEIVKAHRAGSAYVKVFPCGSLGTSYFKELQGPLSHIPMIAVGGVTMSNAREYLQAGAAALGVGSSLINMKAAIEGDFHAVRQQAQAFVQTVRID
ncbi:bifunctional 4-hydroxy-2-oxoglutarate aldolase/2-dehydro-3-deoxy-phosphogluconate aldolase [Paenibacillus alkalitolerans]|uniref:bifunctional 4-hydroxy-2-oxoglutarate aldolase/2-dehydro-3-deoxy-phosphogluconate aldolase n=1 Tax=Paenibacillus alkalitolerans TaxID=2799335 RepID=UPI001F44400F|nr:bifunctional 4-hydroxy-2-oxoglutarate aldolase/2-dehydro-3-deoxy-phosphogluconate aldolase [Paenibacillus alkalitolerans]